MVMIKAFGYGSGGYELAKLLSYHHVNYLGVAFADEGISLRNSGIQTPIMVLNPEISSFYSIIQHQLEPEIYNIRGLRAFLQVAKELGVQNYPVHLKLDTGMHRLGLEKIHLAELISLIKDNQKSGRFLAAFLYSVPMQIISAFSSSATFTKYIMYLL